MRFFYSRRTFNQSDGRFSNNRASVTRYVSLSNTTSAVTTGHLMDAQAWAQGVHAQSQNNDVVIYVHGFNTSQNTMLQRMDKISAGLKAQNYQGAVVAFDWPSDGQPWPSAYRRDWFDAKAVARHMVLDGIKLLREANPNARIHLLAHSLGAFLALRGFGEVGNAFFPGQVEQAVFVAADTDQDWMIDGAWGSLVMQQRCDRLTNYYSLEDQILDLAGQFLNGNTLRSGRHGIRPDPAPTFADVSCGDRYLSEVPSHQQGPISSHSWYFDSSRFYQDLASTFSGGAGVRQNLSNGDQRLTP